MNSIILLTTFGILNLFVGFRKSNKLILPLVFLFLLIVLLANFYDWNNTQTYFEQMLTIDNFAVAFTAVVVLTTILVVPFGKRYADEQNESLAEFFSILLFALVGAIMMVSYENLIMLFVGIEILSISMYVLAGSDKKNLKSNEAGLKYFLMGSFATGILLFGIVLIYGATGTFTITEISSVATTGSTDALTSPLLAMGLLFTLIGISFKVSAAPFHFWTPDVYEGTPTLFTAFMSTVVKTAGFAGFYKLMSVSFAGAYNIWFPTLVAMTVITLVIGNIGAATQNSFKRMMAYSSISHAGYLMIALLSFNDRSENAIFFYSLAYSITTIAAFGILKIVSDQREDVSYNAFNGLGRTNPLLAAVMTISMCSLAGIPLTGGFFGKLFIFSAALEQNILWLIIVAIIMSMVGIYYYFRVVIAMYMREPSGERVKVDTFTTFTLIFIAILTMVLGIFPGIFSDVL
ncbi:NADH-quinone oxidoreductase subunit N [Adhaeribacter pallidiroseus]|uniref:NADH-quinone oxidoreductase subunit N n=1 Tax=Adhaeribacter pallidiroseus TaxID=2072847 RepID=A0A369QAL4_9BACT|nr:NADH-quinone oxidoreductase subunit N [Adhaeribacter pallidiroseus]RDC61502.1 NADH:ubiquinone reductase (H(+)-translocating) [Adhaeribacter pallidiroseus]